MSIIKCLFWNANDSIAKLMASITSNSSLWDRLCYQNVLDYNSGINKKNLQQYKSKFSLIVE